jgi:hypothetical protein
LTQKLNGEQSDPFEGNRASRPHEEQEGESTNQSLVFMAKKWFGAILLSSLCVSCRLTGLTWRHPDSHQSPLQDPAIQAQELSASLERNLSQVRRRYTQTEWCLLQERKRGITSPNQNSSCSNLSQRATEEFLSDQKIISFLHRFPGCAIGNEEYGLFFQRSEKGDTCATHDVSSRKPLWSIWKSK